MTLTTSLWRVEGDRPLPVLSSTMDLESRLEDLIVADADLLGPDQLLLIDRQVATSHGKSLDILAIDDEARLHAIELKRGRTPRDVVAQVLDYGWWVRTLTLDDVRDIWTSRRIDASTDAPSDFEAAYAERFGLSLDPETFNTEHKLTVVAASLDPGTPRIVEYLSEDYDVPINAVLFTHFTDGDRQYLSRTWLRPPGADEARPSPKRSQRGQHQAWNGRDVFVPLGRLQDDPERARWKYCLKYQFVSAGGGGRYWKPMRIVEPGMRIFGYVGGGGGYVAVGEAIEALQPLRELEVEANGGRQRFIDLPDCPEHIRERALNQDPEVSEYAVPVRWLATREVSEGVFETGMRAQQLPCRLKHHETITKVEAALGIEGT